MHCKYNYTNKNKIRYSNIEVHHQKLDKLKCTLHRFLSGFWGVLLNHRYLSRKDVCYCRFFVFTIITPFTAFSPLVLSAPSFMTVTFSILSGGDVSNSSAEAVLPSTIININYKGKVVRKLLQFSDLVFTTKTPFSPFVPYLSIAFLPLYT